MFTQIENFAEKMLHKIKWQHKLIIFAILISIVPAAIIGLNLINKTEQELTQSINTNLTQVADNVSSEINYFFVNQIEKQFLIKESLENGNLNIDNKVALVASAVGTIDGLISMTLIFKKRNKLSVAIQSNKHFVDSLELKNKEFGYLISNQVNAADLLIKHRQKFGEPIYIKSLDKWFIYSILPVNFNNYFKAYLVSILDLSSLQNKLSKSSYSAAGKIIVTNLHGNSIFNSIDSLRNKQIVKNATAMLKGNSRITEVSNFKIGGEKYVVSVAFTENVKWVVIAIQNYSTAYRLVSSMKTTIYVWIFAGVLFALILLLFLVQKIGNPISHLAEQANLVAKGNFDIKIDYKVNDSIGALGNSMGEMAKTLKNNFQKIEKQKHELEEYNKTLEIKVHERTQELKETNKDLQKAYLQVLELNNEKNEFLGIAAHDLKNPLAAIKGFGEIIRDDKKLTENDLKDFADNIVNSAKRMFSIITSLLDVNKIEEGRIAIKYTEVSANEIVEAIIKQNYESAARKNISISFNKLPGDIKFETDRELLLQILDNFLSNAVKFSTWNKLVKISISDSQNKIAFSVKDSGPGLSDEDKSKLFNKFTKLSARPTGGENSTGLGLSIAEKIAEMLGGEILVKSEIGTGATFTIALPK